MNIAALKKGDRVVVSTPELERKEVVGTIVNGPTRSGMIFVYFDELQQSYWFFPHRILRKVEGFSWLNLIHKLGLFAMFGSALACAILFFMSFLRTSNEQELFNCIFSLFAAYFSFGELLRS